jgi:NAD(P)-dependent dehydrogenase (short-subunit alcohol dehydrogenase family)
MEARPRTAVVTGSTSGIGKAIAVRLLQAGYHVVLNYSTHDRQAVETLESCRELAPKTMLVKADVSDSSAVTALMTDAVASYGSLDVLVNNAALAIDGPALEMAEEDWDRVMDVNLKGAFLCAQQAARHMVTQHSGGVILNIGASTGIRGRRNGVNTCASKAGLMIMTQCLALELAPKVRVNTIVPGMTITEETRRRFHLDDPAVLRTREGDVPMKRLGRPEDVADAVILMLSHQARFITGQRVIVDGGQYMW